MNVVAHHVEPVKVLLKSLQIKPTQIPVATWQCSRDTVLGAPGSSQFLQECDKVFSVSSFASTFWRSRIFPINVGACRLVSIATIGLQMGYWSLPTVETKGLHEIGKRVDELFPVSRS
jgi:hypothetical protein